MMEDEGRIGAGCAIASERQPEIAAVYQQHERSINDLEKTMHELYERLTPVMRETRPEPDAGELEKKRVECPSAPMAVALHEHDKRVVGVIDLGRQILRRLEV